MGGNKYGAIFRHMASGFYIDIIVQGEIPILVTGRVLFGGFTADMRGNVPLINCVFKATVTYHKDSTTEGYLSGFINTIQHPCSTYNSTYSGSINDSRTETRTSGFANEVKAVYNLTQCFFDGVLVGHTTSLQN